MYGLLDTYNIVQYNIVQNEAHLTIQDNPKKQKSAQFKVYLQTVLFNSLNVCPDY